MYKLTQRPHVPTYLALGDSYTICEAVPNAERWPEQFASSLNAGGFSIAQPVTIIAKTGWTTDELLQAIADAKPLQQHNWVSLQIGANNQYRGRGLENFRFEFKQLAEIASQLCKNGCASVQVLSIPDWGQTPFGLQSGRDLNIISAEIDAFNGAAESTCRAHGVAFLDITGLTREYHTDPAMHARDGLHPSAAMYRLWANALLCTGTFGRL